MADDARGKLIDDPFAWRITKDGRVFVSRAGTQVSVIAGRSAERLIEQLDRADENAAQHLLARATGHYRHGNER